MNEPKNDPLKDEIASILVGKIADQLGIKDQLTKDHKHRMFFVIYSGLVAAEDGNIEALKSYEP